MQTASDIQMFDMVGQYAGASNFTTQVSQIERDLVRQLCKDDGRKFVTTTAD